MVFFAKNNESMTSYNPQEIEKNAQSYWMENQSFKASESPGSDKFYCLSMLPYPSGHLHMGHVRNYTIGDIASRHQGFHGKNVLQPMGWDAFGLPAENAAIKHKASPAEWTKNNIQQMKAQLMDMGFAYDWSREISTCDASYYRWEQWLFNQLLEKNLVYRKQATVNWDPVDHTVLANEQVVDGKGWRSGAEIERKVIDQWFMRITDYADELIDSLDTLERWPEHVKNMQRNWIGRSYGAEVTFDVCDREDKITVFTTRPDTLYGVTYLAIAFDHPLAQLAGKQDQAIQTFNQSCSHTKTAEADLAQLDKKGIQTPFFATHPLSGEKLPIWIANFVLSDYGDGAVMAVPAHDSRDHAFAVKYDLPIIYVIASENHDEAMMQPGTLINSEKFNGLHSDEAKNEMIDHLVKLNKGQKRKQFRLRDWGVSRQRYWGCPIPVRYNQKGEVSSVPDAQLPVRLPTDITLTKPQSPLPQHPEFSQTIADDQGNTWRPEFDTFDTFVESSWYYLRYCSFDQHEAILDDRAKFWTPVDLYIGGIEHANMHLLYARFMHKIMRDLDLVDSDEPFTHLITQGMVLKDGAKMSKSKGNTVDPTALIERYGADTLRFFVTFAAPPEQSFEWSEGGVQGCHRFLNRLWQFAHEITTSSQENPDLDSSVCEATKPHWIQFQQSLDQANRDYERYQLNTVASACMKCLNELQSIRAIDANAAILNTGLQELLVLLNPITPHITHQLWRACGYGDDILLAPWPKARASMMQSDRVEWVIQFNGKKRGMMNAKKDADEATLMALIQDHDSLHRYLEQMSVVKVIVVPGKLVNIVVKPT